MRWRWCSRSDKLAAGERWQESGLVFTTKVETAMDAPTCGVTSAVLSAWSRASIR